MSLPGRPAEIRLRWTAGRSLVGFAPSRARRSYPIDCHGSRRRWDLAESQAGRSERLPLQSHSTWISSAQWSTSWST